MSLPAVYPLNDVSLPSGGVILRSSEGVEFKAYKNILALASPFFRDMFSLPQATNDPIEDLAVVQLSETSTTLDTLLRMVYPVIPPSFKGIAPNGEITNAAELIKCIEPVLEAALKYDMSIVVRGLCSKLLDAAEHVPASGSVVDDTLAVRVYALACRFRLKDEARLAAYAALRGQVRGVFFDGLRNINAAHYFRLVEYHEKVVNVVLPIFQAQSLPTAYVEQLKCDRCCASGSNGERDLPNCWLSYSSSAESTVRLSPRSSFIFSNNFMEGVYSAAKNCVSLRYPTKYSTRASRCELAVGNFQALSQYLREKIEEAVSKIEIDLSEI